MYGETFRAATWHNTSCSNSKYKLRLSSFKSSGDLKRKKIGHTAVSDTESPSVTWRKEPRENTVILLKVCVAIEMHVSTPSSKYKLRLSSFKSSGDLKRKKIGHTAVSDTESPSVTWRKEPRENTVILLKVCVAIEMHVSTPSNKTV